MTARDVLVLGGNGFIGSALVKQLQRRGAEVLIGTRAKNRCLAAGERRICFHNAKQEDWHTTIEGCQIVINTVGILRQRWKESYDSVHHDAVRNLAGACAAKNIRLIHVSVLGLQHKTNSQFLLSKARGEKALMMSGADWIIIRPSLLEGETGYGARWFRKVANWPVHFTPADAKGKIAPLHVNDLAKAICDIAFSRAGLRIYELGGERGFSFEGYLSHLNGGKPKIGIRVAGIIVRICSHLFDILHLTPLSFGHYELMKNDNLPSEFPVLAREPGVAVGKKRNKTLTPHHQFEES